MANARNYSNTSVNTTLNGAITNVGTNVVLTSQTGMPTPPFVLSIEPDTVSEELVLVTSGAGTGGSPYVVTRGYDGTSNIAHSSLVSVQHRVSAIDFSDSRTHEAATGGIHGLSGATITVNGGLAGLTSTLVYNSSTTETAISKAYSIPGGSMVAGTTYRVKSLGTIAWVAGPPTLTLKVKYGSTIMGTITPTLTTSGSSPFMLEGIITCLTSGASGSLNGSLQLVAGSLNATAITQALVAANYIPINSAQQTGVSTTSNQTFQLTATWGTNNSGNRFDVFNSSLEQLF